MPADSFTVHFVETSSAEGNRLAGTLAEALKDTDPTVSVSRERERADTQDFGATLAVIAGTAAATALAKGMAAWLARNSGVRIEIRRGGEVVLVASHLDSKDASRIAEALSAKS